MNQNKKTVALSILLVFLCTGSLIFFMHLYEKNKFHVEWIEKPAIIEDFFKKNEAIEKSINEDINYTELK